MYVYQDCIVHTCTQVNKQVCTNLQKVKNSRHYTEMWSRIKKKRDKKVGLHESMMLWTGMIKP